jgi:RimJ/RimL family protein N-acetyltransferase
MEIDLETERLVLRRFVQADADNLFDLNGDPAVMRFINGGRPTPREVIEGEVLPRILRTSVQFPGFGYWAAVEKATGDFLGYFCLRPPRLSRPAQPGEMELGYRLRRAAWGRGYATEGARALVRKGFAELGVERVVATAYAEHLASRRVLEKVGLKLVRVFRMTAEDLAACGLSPEDAFDGEDTEYALERAEWELSR